MRTILARTSLRLALLVLSLLALSACSAPVEPTPMPTDVALLADAVPLATRSAPVVEETSTPVSPYTPAPLAVVATPIPIPTAEPAGRAEDVVTQSAPESPVDAGDSEVVEEGAGASVLLEDTPADAENASAQTDPTARPAAEGDTIAAEAADLNGQVEEAPESTPPTAEPVPAPTQRPPPEPVPPLLLETEPRDGENWDGSSVIFKFDRLLRTDADYQLSVDPAVQGQITVDGDQVVFTPQEAIEAATRYHFLLEGVTSAGDREDSGAALVTPFSLVLTSLTPLEVVNTQPTNGSTDIETNTPLVVVFNQPVVPLAGIDEQADLPQPLAIEPAVAGSGRWINTSVYEFVPEEGLTGATVYTVLVADVASLSGETLDKPVIFSFMTTQPYVVSAVPGGEHARPDADVSVQFNQPMDLVTTNRSFSLVQVTGDVETEVAGRLTWNEGRDELTFAPEQPLSFGGRFVIRVTTDARSAGGEGALTRAFEQRFSVVPLPAVHRSEPEAGATNVTPGRNISIWFNTPVSPTLVLDNITITPPVTETGVYSYYSDYANRLNLSWDSQPQTAYTITLGTGIADLYGNTLDESYFLTFTTGDRSPFARFNIGQVSHFSAYTTTTVSAFYRNLDELEIALYRLPEREFFRLTGGNQWEIWRNYRMPNAEEHRIWTQQFETTAPRNDVGIQHIELVDQDGDPLPPGLYFLEMALPPQNGEDMPSHAQALIVLSHHNLLLKKTLEGESLAWLTDLRTGAPVAAQAVRFLQDGRLIGNAASDADGIATAELDLDRQQPWLGMVAISGTPGEDDFAVVSSDWNQGIGAWEFGISQGYQADEVRSVYYTDRPIYRPGQTVYWKGIVRFVENETYILPPADLTVHVIVRDDRGNIVLEDDYSPNTHGTLNGALDLDAEAPTGYYSLEGQIRLGPENVVYSGAGFQVAEYRRPEFEISVAPEQEEYVQGDTVAVHVQATYFSGGPLAGSEVTWRLLAEPYSFFWPDAPQGRYFSFAADDPDGRDAVDPYSGFDSGMLQEGEGTTDGEGRFTIEVPADLANALRSQNWSFDVTVQSASNQFVSGRTAVPVHRSQLYIGLSPQGYVNQAGDEVQVDVVTLTPEHAIYPDVELDVLVYDYRWNSVYERGSDGSYRWETSVERSPVYTTSVTMGQDGMGRLIWTPEKGGQYLVVASGQDQDGNPSRSAAFVWVSAASPDAFIPWRRENNDRIELVRDRDLYEPGDTARILVPSPFAGPVHALLTLERAGILEHSLISLESNSETLEIPITSQHIPNIYVSVVLVKGVDEGNPIPAMRLGLVELPVDVSQKVLDVEITPSTREARPGDTVDYQLSVMDHAGQPVPDAEISVALIDRSVLSLASDGGGRLVDRFYYQQPLGAQTSALLVINMDRVSQQVPEDAKGGGGGGPGGLEVRQDFPDIAYWKADLATDGQGQARFSVDLPDNLTTWRMDARAVSDETLVGEASEDVVVSKELLIRPVLPRFFTAGDRAQIGAVVQNTSRQDLAGATLSMAISGATSIAGLPPATFDLASGGQARHSWPIEVESGTAQVVVTFTVAGGSLADAVQMTLPVVRYETPEIVSTAGSVPLAGRVEGIRLPDGATDSGELQVSLQSSLAAGMLDGLGYLKHFPYECNEQTVSRFLPNLFTVEALKKLDVSMPGLETDLAFQLGVGLQRLVNRQNSDGGWGWWAGDESNAYITGYVLWGLWHAKDGGYPVPDYTLSSAVSYLEGSFQAPDRVEEAWRLNNMAFLHFVLSEMGEGDPGRASTLYAERGRLAVYGQAYLALALANIAQANETADPRVQNLLDNIAGQASAVGTGTFWQEESTDWWTMNTDTRSTSIVLATFSRLQPDHPYLPNVVRWLMSVRQAGRWSSTQENAWAIVGLSDWLVASGELNADYTWRVTLNGTELGDGIANADTLDQDVTLTAAVVDLLRDEANILRLTRSNDTGQLYYTTHLRYYLDAMAIPARDRGIVISRATHAAEGDQAGQRINTAQVGDVISVTVTLVAPTDMHYLVVEVPLPAGTEAIDTRLATTSDALGGPQFGPAAMPDERGTEGTGGAWWWRNWLPSHTDLRDEKVALFATFLPAGAYEYTFLVRASLAGEFRVLPAHAEQMYFPEIWGRSAGALFTVTE